MSFPIKQESQHLWQDAFNIEKTLLDFADDSLNVSSALVKQYVQLSGEATRLNPNGFACVYGSWENMREIVRPAIKKRVDGRIALILMNVREGLKASRDPQTLNNLLVQYARKAFVPQEVLDNVSSNLRFGDGFYRMRSAFAAMEADQIPEDSWMLVLLEETRRKGGTYRFTLPGGKRQLFETAHYCARRALLEECGIELAIPFDAPAVSLLGNDSATGILFVRSVGSDSAEIGLKPGHLVSYGDRFRDWSRSIKEV
jgi:8-oxo-dGTP pyrophosphatase MutT (NUDIX family)